jgi:hypothetical protein
VIDPLTTLQEAVAAKLREQSFFQDIPVLTERQQDIQGQIDKALGAIANEGKSGIFALVLTPSANTGGCQTPGEPYFDDVTLTVEIAENVTINMGATGTQKPAALVALMVAKTLHLYGVANQFSALDTKKISLIPDKDLLAYHVDFKTALNAVLDLT